MVRHRLLRRTVASGPRGKLISGVRAFHRGAPTLDDIQNAGLTLESDEITIPNPDGWFYDRAGKQWRCVLWAENWPAIQMYTQLHTQLRWGPAGPVGLDFNTFLHEIDRRSLSKDEYDDLFGSLRVIERVALDELRTK